MKQPVMLVTGASRGIGAEIAKMAGRSGYKVGVNYHRSEQPALEVVAEIKANGTDAVALQADAGDSAQVAKMFERLDAELGTLDALINNAGMLSKFDVAESDFEQLNEVFLANVFSQFYCAREAVRRMSTKAGGRGGAIVNMSSVAARTGGLSGGAAYAATKGAIDAFTLALAKEVGTQGIRVNAMRPGLIATEIHNVHGGLEQMERLAKTAVPLGRSGSVLEVAEVALWLCSGASSYVHGAVIDVSGGR